MGIFPDKQTRSESDKMEHRLEELVNRLLQISKELTTVLTDLDQFELEFQREKIIEADCKSTETNDIVSRLRELDPDGENTKAYLLRSMSADELLEFHDQTGIALPSCCSRLLALEIANGCLSERRK